MVDVFRGGSTSRPDEEPLLYDFQGAGDRIPLLVVGRESIQPFRIEIQRDGQGVSRLREIGYELDSRPDLERGVLLLARRLAFRVAVQFAEHDAAVGFKSMLVRPSCRGPLFELPPEGLTAE